VGAEKSIPGRSRALEEPLLAIAIGVGSEGDRLAPAAMLRRRRQGPAIGGKCEGGADPPNGLPPVPIFRLTGPGPPRWSERAGSAMAEITRSRANRPPRSLRSGER